MTAEASVSLESEIALPAPRIALWQSTRRIGGQCEKRTPDTDRPGDRGGDRSVPDLFSIYGSAAFQLAFGAEERVRADVSELLYSGRGLPTHGCKETIRASLDDCSSSLVEHRPWRGDGYSNRRSPDSRRPQELYRCGRFHCDRSCPVSASAGKTRGG